MTPLPQRSVTRMLNKVPEVTLAFWVFYRGEHSRTTPGNGLGLTLVRAVAELHDAKIHIRALAPGLLVFCLPVIEPPIITSNRDAR